MPAASTKKVLIVEDDATVRTVLHRRLENAGLEVAESVDGVAGLEAMDRDVFDCILLDFKMPRKDGLTVLAERGATRNAHTPVYVLTSMPGDLLTECARELGASRILHKNHTSPGEVVEIVKQEVLKA